MCLPLRFLGLVSRDVERFPDLVAGTTNHQRWHLCPCKLFWSSLKWDSPHRLGVLTEEELPPWPQTYTLRVYMISHIYVCQVPGIHPLWLCVRARSGQEQPTNQLKP